MGPDKGNVKAFFGQYHGNLWADRSARRDPCELIIYCAAGKWWKPPFAPSEA
jgi:hypothetical protein